MAFLLDTDVISETQKTSQSRMVMDWLYSLEVQDIWTTSANMAELEYGAAILTDVSLRRLIESWIAKTVRPWFGDRILGINESVLQRWLFLIMQAKKEQRNAPHIDLLVAAAALEMHMTVATRDVAPFIAAGVPTLNPWTGERFNGA